MLCVLYFLLLSVATATPNGYNSTTTHFPEHLAGVYEGDVINYFPLGWEMATPYAVRLELKTQPEEEHWNATWREAGRISYGPDLSAPVLHYYPTDTDEHFGGERPTGLCFTLVENFLDPSSEGRVGIPWVFAYFMVCEQTSRSLYYTYMQGTIALAKGYLYSTDDTSSSGQTTNQSWFSHPSLQFDDGQLEIPANFWHEKDSQNTDNNSQQQPGIPVPEVLIPGPIGSTMLPGKENTILVDMRWPWDWSGTFRGSSTVYEPNEFGYGLNLGGTIPYSIRSRFRASSYLFTGSSTYNSERGLTTKRSQWRFISSKIIPMPQFCGEHPKEDQRCFNFYEGIYNTQFGLPFDMQFFTMCEQSDDTFYWTATNGKLVSASGYLEKRPLEEGDISGDI
eukprot:Lithocolla_globosa_v1_NODE_1596_length_2458_cov_10.517270.p1 type:complete len:394 gc:universal NODE_1596_length_2458_cov_10.517270:2232-1051(-)